MSKKIIKESENIRIIFTQSATFPTVEVIDTDFNRVIYFNSLRNSNPENLFNEVENKVFIVRASTFAVNQVEKYYCWDAGEEDQFPVYFFISVCLKYLGNNSFKATIMYVCTTDIDIRNAISVVFKVSNMEHYITAALIRKYINDVAKCEFTTYSNLKFFGLYPPATFENVNNVTNGNFDKSENRRYDLLSLQES